MSGFYRIKDVNDKWYSKFEEIYSTSFPIHEQRNPEQQTEAFNSINYRLLCIINNNTLHSFVALWDFDNYIYIEHFAVNNELRGQNIGSTTLQRLKEEYNKTIILEIDPVVDDISKKRLKFYERLGFKLNPYRHLHPAYNTKYPPHELLVLSTNNKLTQEQYNIFKNDLETIVMKRK